MNENGNPAENEKDGNPAASGDSLPDGGLGHWSNPDRTDMRNIRRAQRQGWGVTPEMLAKLPKIMNSIAENEDAPVRDRVAATKTIVSMVGQDDAAAKGEPESTDVNVMVVLPDNGRDSARSDEGAR